MTVAYNVYGPPGSGKTRVLTNLFIEEARRAGGPDRVASVTYTKVAATELITRLATAMNIKGTPDSLRRSFPYVGTIHSLCLRQLGRPPVVGPKELAAFCREKNLQLPVGNYGDEESFVDTGYLDPRRCSEIDVLLRLRSITEHRMIEEETAWTFLPSEIQGRFDRDYIIEQLIGYHHWKLAQKPSFIDFEDMLAEGALAPPLPVSVLLLDEAQDCTPLMWYVIARWAASTKKFVAVGDPWQAIHAFNSASPAMFRARPGRWISLGKSYRLSDSSVTYAKNVLKHAGWADPLIDSWYGLGSTHADGSRLYLARTHALVDVARKQLIRDGIPFRQLKGFSPLQSYAADVYRLLYKLRAGQPISAKAFRSAIEKVTDRYGGFDEWRARAFVRMPGTDDDLIVDDLSGLPLDGLALPWGRYFRDVEQTHGAKGLFTSPQNVLSTIHGAKGKEADRVTLLRSWGALPYRALGEPEGAKEEACVAYVASSRHRVSLDFMDTPGESYPFPSTEV